MPAAAFRSAVQDSSSESGGARERRRPGLLGLRHGREQLGAGRAVLVARRVLELVILVAVLVAALVAKRRLQEALELAHLVLHVPVLAPRAEVDESQRAGRDVIFVLDTSGSMAGEKMDQARKALRLRERDNYRRPPRSSSRS